LLGSLILVLVVNAGVSAEPTTEAPLLHLTDSVNPGTADYLTQGIDEAEKRHAPYVVIEMDTPGGLLDSTRAIVQRMLNARIPVVVYIAPRGAHAGSAGALITLAADVAVMAPGTNIGAAHPVTSGGEHIDKVMQEKMVNDTAAFAQSIAKVRGRNTDWASRFVRESASVTAEDAQKNGIIDFIAEDTTDLIHKLRGYKLKTPKNGITQLPDVEAPTQLLPMNVKQRLVNFFSDPNLAYLILSLGGLCLWVELSHPGLVLPGIVGSFCIILSLVSFQMLPISYGALGLIFLGMILLVAELFFPTYGVLGIGGIVAFVFGSLFLMDTAVPEFQISLSLIFPTAAVLAAAALLLALVVWRSRRTRPRSGLEALIGEYGEVREGTADRPGKVFIHGELWNAISKSGETIPQGAIVVVTEVKNLLLVVASREKEPL
jgi:membrane-bound serine protease (ClpP class)